MIIGIFLGFAGYGLTSYFTNDDVMNLAQLHEYFTMPLRAAVLNAVNPFSVGYRPLGGAFYRVIYAAAGWNPLPFRCACFALMLVNLYLACQFILRLTRSIEAGFMGALFISYNAALTQLYTNTGTVYDLLAFTCCVLGLTEYAGRRRWWLLISLTVLAMQAKEMGIMLAAGIVLYQLWFRVRGWWSAAGPVAVTAGMLLHRQFASNAMGDNPLYRPTYSMQGFLHSAGYYQDLLLHARGQVLLWWLAAAALAGFLRSKEMGFGLSFWIAGMVPICLIPPRDGYVLYVPALGLATYLGALWLRVWPRGQLAGFAACAVGMIIWGARGHAGLVAKVRAEDEPLRQLVREIPKLHPALKRNAQILFLSDPFKNEQWTMTYTLRLLYQDSGIWVDRAVDKPHARSYDYVFDYRNDLVELPARGAACGGVAGTEEIDDSDPRICWSGGWISGKFGQALSQTVTYSSEGGSTAVILFHGARLTYVYTKARNRGMAQVTIDGTRKQVIDQYAPEAIWQASWVMQGLGPGEHRAEILVMNQKRAEASAVTVDVDGFRIQ